MRPWDLGQGIYGPYKPYDIQEYGQEMINRAEKGWPVS